MKDLSLSGSAAASSNDLFIIHLYKLLVNKANEMSFDDFCLYYAKYMILQSGNKETTKEFLAVLGVPINSGIDVIYNELRKK